MYTVFTPRANPPPHLMNEGREAGLRGSRGHEDSQIPKWRYELEFINLLTSDYLKAGGPRPSSANSSLFTPIDIPNHQQKYYPASKLSINSSSVRDSIHTNHPQCLPRRPPPLPRRRSPPLPPSMDPTKVSCFARLDPKLSFY